MSKHTPGPWRAEFAEDGGYDCMTHAWHVRAKQHRTVVALDLGSYGQKPCVTRFRSQEAEANARLIAAAPELLAALKQARDFYNNAGSLERFAEGFDIDTVVAAIAKAEGEGE